MGLSDNLEFVPRPRGGYSLLFGGVEIAVVEIRGDGWHGKSTVHPRYYRIEADLGLLLGAMAWMAGACEREDAKRVGCEVAARWASPKAGVAS